MGAMSGDHDSSVALGEAMRGSGAAADFLRGGETGELMRRIDWARTSLGAADKWPQSLRSAVRIVLTSRFAMWMAWGRDLNFLYNDTYAHMTLGEKHPRALGMPSAEVWPEIWSDIGPRVQQVMRSGVATWDEALLLFLERSGYPEETYHTFSYSPLFDDDGEIAGLLCVVTEETERVIGERRLTLLRDLASALTSTTRSADVLSAVESSVNTNQRDLPFTLTYLFEEGGSRARLACATGIVPGAHGAPLHVEGDDEWPAANILEHGEFVVIDHLDGRHGVFPSGGWDIPPRSAAVVPIAQAGQDTPAGFFVAGLNPFRRFDEAYAGFVSLVAGQIGSSLANARAYEEEKRRAEALAELDRAKTTFFSNVSHEFRTPLTLMLGPLEDLLRAGQLPPSAGEALHLMQRNGQRLLKLVNTLLDFSRIEAGRVRAHYEPVDLAAYTSELVSTFRSAVERVGMRLLIDTPPLDEPIYVDTEMWEKVVLNLVSNAFKYTMEGEIAVALRTDHASAVLTVRDTGSGIPADELPKLFNRFHRVEGARARTHEGTGIGLALVQELVRLHGGTVEVESHEGEGSTFTVCIPRGTTHLPADRIATTIAPMMPVTRRYVDEALRWIPESEPGSETGEEPSVPLLRAFTDESVRGRVLLADDNADMRAYVRRLLTADYEVVEVADGAEALSKARAVAPDLILSDVMMPNLDGFGLLRELRASADTSGIPVILLSARAGEEARVEGLNAGADDYIVKPFAAREMLARVSSTLTLARVRRESHEAIERSEERYRSLIEASAAIVWTAAPGGTFETAQPRWAAFTGQPDDELLGRGWLAAVHPDDRERTIAWLEQTIARGVSAEGEHRLRRHDGEYRQMRVRIVPIVDGKGSIREFVGVHTDVTVERRLEQVLETERNGLRQIFERSPAFITTLRGPNHVFEMVNTQYQRLIGEGRSVLGKAVAEALPELVEQGFVQLLEHVYQSGEPFAGREVPVMINRAGALEERIVDFLYHPTRETDGTVNGIFVHGVDVTEQVRARQKVEQQAAELERAVTLLQEQSALNQTITDNATSALLMLDSMARPTFMNPTAEAVTGYSLPELQGRPVHAMLHHTRPDGTPYPESECLLSMRLARGERLQGHRDQFIRKDGSFYPVAVALSPVAGPIPQYVLEFRDITAEIEGELALKEANRRKDEFLATLSHELRTPLTAILGWSRMLQMAADDPETVKTAIDTIEKSARVQAQLIEDVLDLSRITSGKVRIEPQEIDIAEIAAAASDAVRLAAGARGLTLDLDAPAPGIATILGDPGRLQQIIWNLLTNAIKFTKDGGSVRMAVTTDATTVTITVTDSGIGIRKDFLPYIFEPFRQAESSTTRAYGGLGLGLSIVRYLVELHGGSITAESEGEGRGAVFTVVLPRLRSARAIDAASSAGAVKPGNVPAETMIDLTAVSVLVIDDQPSIRDYLAAVLERVHATVHSAGTVQEAIQQIEMYGASIVLCDIAMPDEDGYSFLNWLRASGALRATPVIAVTAFGRSEDQQKILKAGFDGYVRKPVEPERLTRAVREALDAAAARSRRDHS
jgi:PAS domain S-box-containing protein